MPKEFGGCRSCVPATTPGAVLFVKLHEKLCIVQLCIGPASLPEWSIEAGVELIVDRQEIPNVIPGLSIIIIVKFDERGSGCALTIDQHFRQGRRFQI